MLGLNTTAQNLIGFLNLAELGIGGAIAFTLYKPIFEKDSQTINEIVSVQGWLYRRVAFIVIVGACVLMLFFPAYFRESGSADVVHVRFIYCAVDKYSFGLFRQLSSDSADCRPKGV